MKYFTTSWHEAQQSEEENEKVRQSYWRHIKAITPQFSPQVDELANRTNLHDGLIQRVVFNVAAETLLLELRTGDRQAGYLDLGLEYRRVVLTSQDLLALKQVVLNPMAELLYDEVDISDSGYLHRLLFWPYQEIDIGFAQLALEKKPSASRAVPKIQERFAEIRARN